MQLKRKLTRKVLGGVFFVDQLGKQGSVDEDVDPLSDGHDTVVIPVILTEDGSE